jgi:hypothetical protein
LRRSPRHREQYSGHSGEVAGRHRQLEVQIDPLQSSEDRLPDTPHCLAPAKVLFDALADRLAQVIANMSRRVSIDGAAAASAVVLSHMRRYVARSAVGNDYSSAAIEYDDHVYWWPDGTAF